MGDGYQSRRKCRRVGPASGNGGSGLAGAHACRTPGDPTPATGRLAGHLRTDTEEGRWQDRLGAFGSRNLEPDSRIRAVARRLWVSARTALADLERGGWRSKATARS